MKPKEILVFGATGNIGRNLIRKLTKNNYKVCLLYTSDAADDA